MKRGLSEEDILTEVLRIFPEASQEEGYQYGLWGYSPPKGLQKGGISIEALPQSYRITIVNEYEPLELSFARLRELANFFETNALNVIDTINEPGCATCDYGSRYGWTLEIKADPEKWVKPGDTGTPV